MAEPSGGKRESGRDESQPSRRERLRPLELVGLSAVLAVFAGGVVALVTRDWLLRVPVAAGAVFIVSAMGLALLGLGMKPNAEDLQAREEFQESHVRERHGDSDDDGMNGGSDGEKQ